MAKFTIRGKNIEITPALRDYVEKKVGKITKYFEGVDEITVLLTVIKGKHIVEVTVPVQNVIIRGEESTADMYTSIDLVTDKLERQVRKYKNKLKQRLHKGGLREEAIEGIPASEAEPLGEYPVIKAKRFVLKPMGVQEAIMQMNLLNHEFFVFRDDRTEDVCVVYRRWDGNYGLIEPQQ